jgi:hypothetical protein
MLAGDNRQANKYMPGNDIMIFTIFSQKKLGEKLAFFAQTTASFCNKLIVTLVFGAKRQFFAENRKDL